MLKFHMQKHFPFVRVCCIQTCKFVFHSRCVFLLIIKRLANFYQSEGICVPLKNYWLFLIIPMFMAVFADCLAAMEALTSPDAD